MANLARSLRSLGHDVTIVTATPGPAEWEGLAVHRLPSLTWAGAASLLRVRAHIPELSALVADSDVVHCHYTFFLTALLALVNFGRKPLVVTLHGLGTLDSSVQGRPGKAIFRWLSFKAADSVLATSSEMAGVAQRFTAPGRITVVENGVWANAGPAAGGPPPGPDRSGPSLDGGTTGGATVVAVRRLEPKNGVQYLVEAAPELVELLGPGVRIRIVGDGALAPYLVRRIGELGVDDVVELMGSLPNEEAMEVMRSADVVVLPSSAESSSIAALEAMSLAKPVVASAVGALPELLGRGERGVLVRLFDRETSDYDAPLTLTSERISLLARAIAGVVTDTEKAATLGRSAQSYVRSHHDWMVVGRRVAAAYQAAAASPGPLRKAAGAWRSSSGPVRGRRVKSPSAPGVVEDQLRVPRAAVPYILLQRTELQVLSPLWRQVRRRPPAVSVQLESWLGASRAARGYKRLIADEYRTIEPVLPTACRRVMDIGCGVGGLDVLLYRRYSGGGAGPELYLVDKSARERSPVYGYDGPRSFYNSFGVVSAVLSSNGVPSQAIKLMDADSTWEVDGVDLVVSLLSWGFHYPLAVYVDHVRRVAREGATVVLDVRKGTGDLEQLQGLLGDARVVLEDGKRARVAGLVR